MASTPIRCGPDEPRPTHHLRLKGTYDGDIYDIGLILSDGSGRPDPYQITRDRLSTTSLKISQGNPKYSDMELPFTPMPQDDWSGGRGNEMYEDDVTRYLEGRNINTMFNGKAFLAGQPSLGYGYRKMQYYDPGSVYWQPLIPGDRRYLAYKFTADNDYDIDKLGILVKRAGTPGALTALVRHDNNGNPGLIMDTMTLAASSVGDILGINQYFNTNHDANYNGWDGTADFETGDTSQFDSEVDADGHLNASTNAKHDGTYGAAVTFVDNNAAYGVLNAAAADQKVGVVEFWFNCDSATINAMGEINIFEAVDGASNPTFRINISYFSGWLAIKAQALRDWGDWVSGSTYYASLWGSAGWLHLKMEFGVATSAGADNGYTKLYSNGTLVQSLTNINNDEKDWDNGRFGMCWTNATTRSGEYYLDQIKLDPYGHPATLDIGLNYWVEVYGAATDNDLNHWKVGTDAAQGAGLTKESSNGTSWTASGIDLYWIAKETDDDPDRVFPFTYKGGQYMLLDYDDANPIIKLNGDRGAADSNTGNLARLNDGTKSWVTNEWAGCVVKVTAGPGSTEVQPWRVITGNDASYLNVSPNWKITHTTDTEYVIVGSKKWTTVFASVMGTNDITDVCVVDDRIYLCRGSGTLGVVIKSIRAYNNSGTWTEDSYDETSNKADHMCVVSHRESGLTKRQIWRANNNVVQVSRGDIPTFGTSITFGTGIPVGDDEDPIVKLMEYIDPDYGNKILWIGKKNGPPWAVKTDVPEMVTLPEMRSVASDNNFKAAIVHDTYMYFSLMKGGVERYFADLLDDVGPNRERGLPENRLGAFEQFEGYPGEFYGALNAGTGYSSILGYDGAWHDTYISDEAGQQIKGMIFQVVPGSSLDWLWFLEGSTFKRIPFPSETIYPYYDTLYPYTHEGVLVTSRMYAGMVDVEKLFDNLKIIADNLEEGVCWIEVDYKVDSEAATWLPFPTYFDTSPSQQVNLVNEGDESVTGKYLMLRFRFQTSDNSQTPEMRASLVESISRIPTKFGYTATVRFETHPTDLFGQPDDYYENGLNKIDDLDLLAETLTVLEMECVHSPFNGIRVFVEAPTLRPIFRSDGEQIEGFLGTLAITQVLKAEESIE